mgnify:CR=1 FL=1
MISFRKSTVEDAKYIAMNLRKADIRELEALGVDNKYKQLKDAACLGGGCFTGMLYDTPATMFGVVPIQEGIGSIWLLGTNSITDRVPIGFLKYSRKLLPVLMEPYNLVGNLVHKENKVHIKWLEWLGFTFIREVTYGPKNEQFIEFAKIKES